MPRIRTIKPDLALDPELADLGFAARYFFVNLLCHCDKKGRCEDNPKRLQAQILPWDGHKVQVDTLISELTPKFIIRYEVGGKKYLQVRNFTKHQRTHTSEPESVIPAPPAAAPITKIEKSDLLDKTDEIAPITKTLETESASDGALTAHQRRTNGGEKGQEGKGKEGKGKEGGRGETHVPGAKAPTHPLMAIWNTHKPASCPAVKESFKKRHAAAVAAWKWRPDPIFWEVLLKRTHASDFLTGRKPGKDHQNWVMKFDWLVKPGIAIKIGEGDYDNKGASNGHNPDLYA